MALPKLSGQQPIAGNLPPTRQFLQFMEETRRNIERADADLAGLISDLAAVQAQQAETQADLQDQVDRLTAILAGTGETFTGLNVGGSNVKPLLDRSNGSRFTDVTAIPGNANTALGTRPDLTFSVAPDDIAPHVSATVTISSHTFRLGGQAVSLSGGTVGGLTIAPTFRYYVYYDDASYAGGAVTYLATQTLSDVTNVAGRFIVGRVTTPDSTGAGGSATIAQPSWNL